MVHCWKDKIEHVEGLYGFGSDEWADAMIEGNGTCMLPHGHIGIHKFTPDEEIRVSVNEEVIHLDSGKTEDGMQ